jgi:mannan endo-1,4-beta-mannosidase
VLYYDDIPERFPAHLAAEIHAHGAIPLAQIDPDHAAMAAVADGGYDAYLRSYARAVRAYGHSIVISFAAEMNGNWDPWGWHHTSPATWIRAWRHVVDMFRDQHADNVTWLWTLNLPSPTTGPFQQWWPGNGYVDWVGIDGYYLVPSQTFSNTFQPMITDIKMLTGKPILLSETAVGPLAGVTKIPDLFAGITRDHLLGLVYFDVAQHNGTYHQDWRLEDDPAALAAFRRAATAHPKRGGA